MPVDTSLARVIRIPNLPMGRLVDEKGMPTDDFLTFLQGLVTSLQVNFGPEGVVVPTQSPANVTVIQNNQDVQGTYTCQLGTIIYEKADDPLNYANDRVLIAVRNSADYPESAPLFKTVTLT